MSRVVREYSLTAGDPNPRAWLARVRGEQDDTGLWHGWIELLPIDGGPAKQTGRETTQSSLDALAYWVTGLETVYLEGALDRSIPLRLDSAA